MNRFINFIAKHLQTVLIFSAGIAFTVIAARYKEGIKKGTNFLIDGLLSLARFHFLMNHRYRKSIIRSYRETKVGYRNLRLDLERNYITLKVCSFVSYRDREPGDKIAVEKMDLMEVLKDQKHLVILGHPGAGKTTLMQWLLLKYAFGQMKEKLEENLIPVFITLRSLEPGQTVDQLIPEILKQHHFKGGEEFIRKKMEKGQCLLIFDGLDEIIDDDTRRKFIDDINRNYGTLYGQSRIIITSRIEDYPVDSFPASFREREILDLEHRQVRDFIYGILDEKDNPGELIRQIEKSDGLKKFVSNPLMLSLLTFVYQESQQRLPHDRVKVYNICLRLMLQDRDVSRGIYEYRNQFDAGDKDLLLRKLAYDFALENRWRFTEKELLEHWKKNMPSTLKESDLKSLLKELLTANGIFKHISGNELSFLHRTFQDYYAAREISLREYVLLVDPGDSNLYGQFIKIEWQEITLFLVGMMEDASYLIQDLSLRSPRLGLQCLVYVKRVTGSVITEVMDRALTVGFQTEYIPEIYRNLIYLAERYGQDLVTARLAVNLANENKRNHRDGTGKQAGLWKIIDQVISHFSPRKQMVYVPSDGYPLRNSPGKPVPGFWMDIYPVTNRDYCLWVKVSRITRLPRHWGVAPIKKQCVPLIMERLPIVDIDYKEALAYAFALNKKLPNREQWRKVMEANAGNEDFLSEDRGRFIKKNKLGKSFEYYYYTRDIDLARARSRFQGRDSVLDLAHDLARAFDLARNLARDLGLTIGLARDLGLNREHALQLARDLTRALDIARDIDLALGFSRTLDLARVRDLSRALDLARDDDFHRSLPTGFREMKKHFDAIREVAKIIEDELKAGWTWEAYKQKFKLGKTLVDALSTFLELLQNPMPGDLLMALRQPGLLTPVDKFPPNVLGVYDLAGNIWVWTSVTNDEGEYLIRGAPWTEKIITPDIEVWLPPNYQDLNLGFRCVCEWDKIGQVKEPGDLGRSAK